MMLKLFCVVVEIGRFVKYDSRRLLIYTISGIMVITALQYDTGGARRYRFNDDARGAFKAD